MALASDLRALGREAWLFLPSRAGEAGGLLTLMNFNPEWRITEGDLPRVTSGGVECIVLDRFQTPPGEMSRWKETAPVIAVDEGGSCRDAADFLIDILIPQKLGLPPANIASPFLLKFPSNHISKRKSFNGVIKTLVSFGQEDAAGLGLAAARALSKIGDSVEIDVTFLRGGFGKSGELPLLPKVKVLYVIPSLAEHLAEYDLVITHYGITAYEAIHAGTRVILMPPTAYHEKLAKAAGFISVRNDTRLQKRLLQIIRETSLLLRGSQAAGSLGNGSNAAEPLASFSGTKREDGNLAELISSFSPRASRRCPVCGGKTGGKSLCRFPERTYRKCPECGGIYEDRAAPPPEQDGSYFFESYKKQYGKTYLEDFPAIKAAGKRRMKEIKALSPSDNSLLDIGCAYGPFLAAAREEGFQASGIDASEEAVLYVRETLGIPAVQGSFPPDAAGEDKYGVISLWYVIEHFPDCKTALAAIKKMLKPGGTLAFSTPSYTGVSGRSSLRKFLERSPADHITVWSPASCKKALSLAGFTLKKTVITGHHPERFPLFGRFAKTKKSHVYWALLLISKLFRLGDTFEAYAKEKN
jgi:2-polyprenyl-3-methyl-5-hydroxy-6-metoxy-1,4-benzoquinol methylase